MKKINLFFLVLGLCFSMQNMKATNPISLESYEETVNNTEKKTSLLKKAKEWFKNAADPLRNKKLAKAALILGLVSLSGWVFIFSGVGFTGMLIAMGLMALTADVLAIIVLVGTAKEKSENKKSRRMAVWGLVLALLTGLFPIAILIGVLAVL